MSYSNKKTKCAVYIFFGFCFLVCLWRALKGFCWSDETFYISTTDRFFRGDVLLKEEWYRTQMSSVICLPFYAIYYYLTGGSAGVVLYFRVLYLIVSFVTAILTYNVIKKDYHEKVALIVATLIMFYAHLNITSFSYYMLSLEFFLISLALVYDYYNTDAKWELVAGGSMFALSVLSLPSLAVAYFAAVIVALLFIALKKVPFASKYFEAVDTKKLWNVLVYTLSGIIIPALLFVIYMFSKLSVAQIIEAIPNIMTDGEHDFTYGFLLRKFFRSVTDVYGRKLTYTGYLLIIISFLSQRFLKKKPLSQIIVILDIVLFVVYAIKSYGHTGYIQTALCMTALPAYFLTEKKNHKLFTIYGVGGLIMALTYNFSSSDFLYVLSIGYFVSAIGCVGFLYDYAAEMIQVIKSDDSISLHIRRLTRLTAVLLSLVCVYTCCVTVALRIVNVYRDAPIGKLNARIENGPAKGLYTSKEHLQLYEDVINVLDEYRIGDAMGSDSNILFSKILPWGYIYTDYRCAYPTTWRATAYDEVQLERYYAINPDKKPDVILVLDEEYGKYEACGDVEDDFNPNLDEMNDYWKAYISDSSMTMAEVACGKIYVKK